MKIEKYVTCNPVSWFCRQEHWTLPLMSMGRQRTPSSVSDREWWPPLAAWAEIRMPTFCCLFPLPMPSIHPPFAVCSPSLQLLVWHPFTVHLKSIQRLFVSRSALICFYIPCLLIVRSLFVHLLSVYCLFDFVRYSFVVRSFVVHLFFVRFLFFVRSLFVPCSFIFCSLFDIKRLCDSWQCYQMKWTVFLFVFFVLKERYVGQYNVDTLCPLPQPCQYFLLITPVQLLYSENLLFNLDMNSTGF